LERLAPPTISVTVTYASTPVVTEGNLYTALRCPAVPLVSTGFAHVIAGALHCAFNKALLKTEIVKNTNNFNR